ncbi:aldehyde dehydrogenase [Streptococcus salivarius]|uniref:Aldehyde dehydrogenase n=1 Tax=Streptococcus salivarius TaxID=1304 RepID=A0AAX2UZM1_STRSL|nr:aldehyde dehydrogenase [Streptococcus salivarius]
MPIFKLFTHEGLEVIVRAKCLTCARNLAADNAQDEGPRTWLDPNKSQIVLVRETDPPCILSRMKRDLP